MTKNFNYYVEGRVFEWTMCIVSTLLGIQFIIWPDTIHESVFHFVDDLVGTRSLITILLLLGWMRGAALMFNGQTIWRIKFGPYTRAVCCVCSSALWVQILVALLGVSIYKGYPAAGIPYWLMFTFGELYVAYTTTKNR